MLFSLTQGPAKASLSLGDEGAGADMAVSSQNGRWLMDIGGRAGLLNDTFTYGMFAGGGYLVSDRFGFYSRLDAEFRADPHEREYALWWLTAGGEPVDNIWLKVCFDYLDKRFEDEFWKVEEYLDQFGLGGEVLYRFSPSFDIAAQYIHYHTDGKTLVTITSMPDALGNTYATSGHIRGGHYDEIGLRTDYTHPSEWVEGSLGISQIWRSYEGALHTPREKESMAAVRSRMLFPDLLRSGLDLSMKYFQEFADNPNRSWGVALAKRFGAVVLKCSYEEQAGNRESPDTRWMLEVEGSIDALFSSASDRKPIKKMAELTSPQSTAAPDDDSRRGYLTGWIKKPVPGMGEPVFKVQPQLVVDKPYFVIDFEVQVQERWRRSTLPVTGTTAEVHKDPGTPVEYRRYSINFSGNTSALPDQVPVTITWEDGFCAATFEWGSTNADNGSETFMVPKTGGTIGNGGTIAVVSNRPEVDAGCSGVLGTVVFASAYVNTLTLSVQRP
jgi:hypothetical protein